MTFRGRHPRSRRYGVLVVLIIVAVAILAALSGSHPSRNAQAPRPRPTAPLGAPSGVPLDPVLLVEADICAGAPDVVGMGDPDAPLRPAHTDRGGLCIWPATKDTGVAVFVAYEPTWRHARLMAEAYRIRHSGAEMIVLPNPPEIYEPGSFSVFLEATRNEVIRVLPYGDPDRPGAVESAADIALAVAKDLGLRPRG